jgi:hypothetical protein
MITRRRRFWCEAPELIRHLGAHGCRLVREGAGHSWWENPVLNRRSADTAPRRHHFAPADECFATIASALLAVVHPDGFEFF